MQPILDSDDDSQPILHLPKAQETVADYSRLIKISFRPRLILLLVMSAVLLLALFYLGSKFNALAFSFFLSLSTAFLIPLLIGLTILVSFLFIYIGLLRETWQMWQDLRSRKVIIYESFITEKLFDESSDTPHHVVLRHLIDKRQMFRITPVDFERCHVGSKVHIVLSFHAKLLLAMRV